MRTTNEPSMDKIEQSLDYWESELKRINKKLRDYSKRKAKAFAKFKASRHK